MADIRIAVSCLPQFYELANAAMPYVVQAYSPFGINLHLERGVDLQQDPINSSNWRDLIRILKDGSKRATNTPLAHVVLANIPPGYDRSINGQLLDQWRGICAIYLGASSFQQPAPSQRLDLVVQVIIHEVGHMFDLVHEFGFGSNYSDAMLTTSNRVHETPLSAWSKAVKDARSRGEKPLTIPTPTIYYPFGVTCRTCLNDAAENPKWWPWQSAFRGDFGAAAERADLTLTVSFENHGRPLESSIGDGIFFTLRLENRGRQPIPIPTHIGPEFGSLSITVINPSTEVEEQYAPQNYKCSSARQSILPKAVILRSFSIIPYPDAPLFKQAGTYILRVRIYCPIEKKQFQIGLAECTVTVKKLSKSHSARQVAVNLVASAHGNAPLPSKAQFKKLSRIELNSAVAYHARYKLAEFMRGKERQTLLTQSMHPQVPVAIRHRSARQYAIDALNDGLQLRDVIRGFKNIFVEAEDDELFETLYRLEDGWNFLKSQE